MKLFNFLKTNKPNPVVIPSMPSVTHVGFALPELPVIKEVKGKDWIFWGDDNLYPQHLKRILIQSPTQGAIIRGKAGMMSGDGFLVNDAVDIATSKQIVAALPANVKSAYETFLNNPNDSDDLETIIYKLSNDWQTYGCYSLEVVWSMDFSKIVTLKHVDVSNIRSGKIINGKVNEYWYSRDWSYASKEGFIPQPIAAFDVNDKEHYNQLIYVKEGTLEYYGEPIYSKTLSYVEIEGKLANFHLSNIVNGFAPSIAIKFYQKPGSPEEQSAIVNGIKKQYGGHNNAGRAMIFFSDGKDLAPEVTDIPVSNLDKQYIAVNDLTIQNILTGNQVTSPLLFGITTPGSLGGNNELEKAYQIFNKSVIEPDRKKIEKTLNKILQVNKIPVTISIMPFNPLT